MALSPITAAWNLSNTTDASGNGNTLTNNNSVTFTAGLIGNAANLGNPNTLKYLSLNYTPSFPITISTWFNAGIVNADGNIWSLGSSGGIDYYQLRLRTVDSHIVFRSNNATQAADVDTGIVASTSTWYNVVVNIISSSSVTIYVNSTITNTAVSVFVASTDRFAIGALFRNTSLQFYSGLVDMTYIFPQNLVQADANALYNGGTGVEYPFPTSSIKTIDGLAYASIKNVNGLAIASVKTANGLS